MVKLLRPKTGESTKGEGENDLENDTISFSFHTKTVRINFTHSKDPCTSLLQHTVCCKKNNGLWDTAENNCVQQGSALGRILFILYVKDFTTSCTKSVPFFFTDETICVHICPKDDILTLQENIEQIVSWMA